MRNTLLIALLIVIGSSSLAHAETSLSAQVDKLYLTTDDTFTYSLTITTSERNIPQPQLPAFEGLVIVSQAQSSSFSVARAESKSAVRYEYILAAPKPGKYKIGPSIIKIKDQAFSTSEFEVQVAEGKAMPLEPSEKPPLPENNPSPEKEQPGSQQPQYTL
jgi:hypothetical protein